MQEGEAREKTVDRKKRQKRPSKGKKLLETTWRSGNSLLGSNVETHPGADSLHTASHRKGREKGRGENRRAVGRR